MNQPFDLLKSQEVRELDALLLDGLDSGESIPGTPEYWDSKETV